MNRPTTLLPALTSALTDLDGFAATLADLADAIDRHDSDGAYECVLRILDDFDQDVADALVDHLTWAGLFVDSARLR